MRITTKLIFFFLLISLMAPAVPAPPTPQSQDAEAIIGLDIYTPQNIYYKHQRNFTMIFYVHNASGYMEKNTEHDCLFHLVNETGQQIIEQYLTRDADGHQSSIVIDEALLPFTGLYTYDIYCNSTEGEYGWTTTSVTINNEGTQPLDDFNREAVIIFIPLFLGFLLIIGAWSITSQDHIALKYGLFLMSLTTPLMSFSLGSSSISEWGDYGAFLENVSYQSYILGIFLAFILMYFMVYLFYQMIHNAAQNKKERLEY